MLQERYWIGRRDAAVRRTHLTLADRRYLERRFAKKGMIGLANEMRNETDWLEQCVRYFDAKGRPEPALAEILSSFYNAKAHQLPTVQALEDELCVHIDSRDDPTPSVSV